MFAPYLDVPRNLRDIAIIVELAIPFLVSLFFTIGYFKILQRKFQYFFFTLLAGYLWVFFSIAMFNFLLTIPEASKYIDIFTLGIPFFRNIFIFLFAYIPLFSICSSMAEKKYFIIPENRRDKEFEYEYEG